MSDGSAIRMGRWFARVPNCDPSTTNVVRRSLDLQRLTPTQSIVAAMGAGPLSYLLSRHLKMTYEDVLPVIISREKAYLVTTVGAPVTEELVFRAAAPAAVNWLFEKLRVPNAEFWSRRVADVAFCAAHTLQLSEHGASIGLPKNTRQRPLRWIRALGVWGLGGTYLGGHAEKDGLVKAMAAHAWLNACALSVEGKPGVRIPHPQLLETISGCLEVLVLVAGLRTLLKEITLKRTLARLRTGSPLSRVVSEPTVERWSHELLAAPNAKGLDFRAGVEFAYWLHIRRTPTDAAGASARALEWVSRSTPVGRNVATRLGLARETLARLS